jgi:hypothetical protein
MLIPWNPTKEEIEIWLKTKELLFSQKDNRNPKLTLHKYLDKYVFNDLQEVFFCDFPHVLQEWILSLKYKHPTKRIRHIEWNIVDITQLQQVDNKFTRVVDFWLENIVVGFITKFAVDTTKYYSATEKYFLKGPQGRYIRTLYTSIKILIYNKGLIEMA